MTDWLDLTRRAAFASHRLIGWIYWDPVAVADYAALGVPDGAGYYFGTRGASLGDAGDDVVPAAFGSIHPDLIRFSLALCREHTTFEAAAAARDQAVGPGLRQHAPEICDGLGELADPLWAAADRLPLPGRVLHASLRHRGTGRAALRRPHRRDGGPELDARRPAAGLTKAWVRSPVCAHR